MTALTIVSVLVLATVIEVAIEVLKPALDPLFERMGLPEDVNPYMYLSLVGGIGLAAAYRMDMLAILDLFQWSAVGMVFTGLVIGRGANFVHDVIERLGTPGTVVQNAQVDVAKVEAEVSPPPYRGGYGGGAG